MTLDSLHDLMTTVDDHAKKMGDGGYVAICGKILELSNALEDETLKTKRDFATQVLLELPACGGAYSVARFTHESAFMQNLIQKKAVELEEFAEYHAAVLGTAWKIEIVSALVPYDDDTASLTDVRIGIQNLFLTRGGFLPEVIDRLLFLGISPQMLCPFDFNAELSEGDDGHGPTASDFFFYEPRFLRWILGRGELEPWPTLGVGAQPKCISDLILLANSKGGDNQFVNQPCTCPRCPGLRIPTLHARAGSVSLTPSECSSDCESEMEL